VLSWRPVRRRGRRPRRRCKGRRRGATPRPAPARVAYVCVPAGTRNHFALDLGIERRIDLASVNGRVFVNNASVGAYAAVVQSKAYRGAKLRTWVRMLPALLGPNAPASELRLAVPDGRGRGRPTFALVSNNPYRLSGIGGVGRRPRLDTGQLGIVAAEIDGAADVAELLALATVGRWHRFRGFKGWSVRTFEVDSAAPVPVGLDGEALVLEPPLRFAALPGALRVRIPRRAHGGSPAAAAVGLTSRELVALLRVAVGADASPTARRPLV
jgi:diacylglycerol kinase family enzyme